MKKTLAVLLAFVVMAAVALGSFSLGMRFGENKALENMEVPSHSKPDAADPDGPEGPSQPQQTDPSQSRPTQPTEPTQPVVCDHAFSNGICKKCGALEPSSFLTYELNADGKSYTLVNGVKDTYYDYSVVIADIYEGLPVTAIGEYAFYHQYGNSGLTSVYIPDTITTIGKGAFCECDGLTSVTIPDSVTTIGDNAFKYCDALTTVTMGNGVTTIGASAFYSCAVLTSVNIPDSVTTIGDNAFEYCDALTTVTMGDGVTTIGEQAFYQCVALTSVSIPDSVTTIGNSAFSYCAALTSVSIPDSVTTIGNYAFGGCDNLAYKRYDTAYYLGNESNPYLCLMGTTSNDISGCNIHKDTKVIAGSAFYYCQNLTSITLPDGLRSIGDSAFRNTGLTAITIPNSVTSIGNSVLVIYKRGFNSLRFSYMMKGTGLTEFQVGTPRP